MKLGKLIGYNPATGNMDNGTLLPDVLFKTFDTTIDDANYEDYSSIENWYNSDLLDWARRRDEISPLFYAITGGDFSGYSNLTASEKLIGAKCFLAPISHRITNGVVTETEDKENWNFLLAQTKKSRLDCVEAMRVSVGEDIRTGTLTLTQTQDFFRDVRIMITNFEQTNDPNFKQWLTNEVGSAYENNGFSQKSYYSVNLKNKLLNIYNGKY